MPRTYQRKEGGRQYAKISKDLLIKAKEVMVKENLSVRIAAERFGISKSTFHDYVSKIHVKTPGGQIALNEEEENLIVKRLITMATWGFPMDVIDLRMLVKAYLDRRGVVIKKFKDNLPGSDWATAFIRRHKDELSTRFSQNIKQNRAKVSPTIIRKYFTNLSKTVEGVPPENIVNYDETNLTDDPGKKKVIVRRGTKYPERVLNTTKTSISLMFAGTAAGHLLPPYVVYKSVHLYDAWITGGPPGTRYNRSSSGWFEAASFEDWFYKIVLPYFKHRSGKKVLIGDNLASHISPTVIETCEINNISFVLLPPNSTNLTQPLDVAVFRPMKRIWSDILLKFKQTARGRQYVALPKEQFPQLLKQLMLKLNVNICANLKSGFKKCGVVPLNEDAVLSRLPEDTGSDVPTSPDAKDVSGSLDDSLVGILKSLRYGKEGEAGDSGLKKKKRLPISPGKSISNRGSRNNDNIMSEGEAGPSGMNKKKRLPVSPRNDDSSTSEDEDFIDDPGRSRKDEEEVDVSTELHIRPSTWILTKIQSETTKKYHYFIAVVLNNETDIQVRFLKHIKGTPNVFVNPIKEEISYLNRNDIVKVLPEPELDRKCRMIFDVDVGLWPK